MVSDVVGVVLAGGQSRRMGRDKARLEVAGRSLAARALDALSAVCPDVVLSGGGSEVLVDLGYPVIADRQLGQGPLAGLEAALAYAQGRAVLVLACDLPRVDRLVLERLIASVGDSAALDNAAAEARAWVGRRGGRQQPLCGLYSPQCLSPVTSRIDRGELAVYSLLAAIETVAVDYDDLALDPFLNINTPAELRALGGAA